MHHILVEEYFRDAMNISPPEANLAQEIQEWLPATIIDAHCHSNLKSHVLELPVRIKWHMLSTYIWFDIAMSKEAFSMLFPSTAVRALRFAHAPKGIDYIAANQYLLGSSPEEDRVALYGLPDNVEYTIQELESRQYAALKMYSLYYIPPVKTIYEYFRPEILEVCQSVGIPIILHLPSLITSSSDQLERLVRDFPQLQIVLAHLGLPKNVYPGLEEVYRNFSRHQNIFMDTAMVLSPEVVELALKVFGSGRIIYGSDQPCNLIRASIYNHPIKGERMAARGYHWVIQEEADEYGHLAEGAILLHWYNLAAIRSSIEAVFKGSYERQKATEKILFSNAAELFSFS